MTQESIDLPERPWGFRVRLAPKLIRNLPRVREFDV